MLPSQFLFLTHLFNYIVNFLFHKYESFQLMFPISVSNLFPMVKRWTNVAPCHLQPAQVSNLCCPSKFCFAYIFPISVSNLCCRSNGQELKYITNVAHCQLQPTQVSNLCCPLPILCQMLLTAACWDKYRVNKDLNTNILSISWYYFIYGKVNLLSYVLPTFINHSLVSCWVLIQRICSYAYPQTYNCET